MFFCFFFLWPVKLGCEDGGRGAIILWKSTGFFISFSGRIKRSTSWTKRWTLTSEECCRVLKDFILQCPLWYSLQLSLVVRSKSKTVEREREVLVKWGVFITKMQYQQPRIEYTGKCHFGKLLSVLLLFSLKSWKRKAARINENRIVFGSLYYNNKFGFLPSLMHVYLSKVAVQWIGFF